MAPLISVITSSLNQREGLIETLDCIRKLDDNDLEHVVVDGVSEDGSLEVLDRSSGPRMRFISELDSGISDAMNKGVSLSSGRWLMFLHCGDRFVDAVGYAKLKEILASKDSYDGIVLDTKIENEGGNWIRRSGSAERSWRKLPYCHQGTVWKKEAYNQVGAFRTDLKICMDFDWHVRAMKKGLKIYQSREVLTVMDGTGISSRTDWDGLSTRLREENRVLVENASSRLASLLYSLYGAVYILLRRVLH